MVPRSYVGRGLETEHMFDTLRTMRQISLLAAGPPSHPATVGPLDRLDLGRGSWIDTRPGWLPGADEWLDELRDLLPWRSGRRQMYDRMVDVPRLVTHFDRVGSHPPPERLEVLAERFEAHYQRPFQTIGCNWYRNGDDSVAWHADKVPRPGDSVVAIIGVGERRPFLVRPSTGGPARKWLIGDGDLIVLGGTIQAHWHHAVPKVRSAGERISIMVRSNAH